MNTLSIDKVKAEEIINILSDIVQKHFINTNGGDYNEQESSNIL